MPARPALLLFDLDDVLVHYDHARRCAALARALGGAADPAALHAALFGPAGLESGCDRGDYDLDEYLGRLAHEHGWHVAEEDFVIARREATRPDPAMLALCLALASQAGLAIFSNNGAWIARHADRILPGLAPLFGDRIICSGALGASKPDPAAFLACCARLGAAPGETLFVDDKAANAAGARDAGIDALHFTGLPALRRDLLARGFDLPGDHHAP